MKKYAILPFAAPEVHPHLTFPIKGEGTACLYYTFPSLGGRGKKGRGRPSDIAMKLAERSTMKILDSGSCAVFAKAADQADLREGCRETP